MFHVVEGFYGKAWSHEERLSIITFIASIGFKGYSYAPKSDRKLRQDVIVPFNRDELSALISLGDHCLKNHLTFQVGLSPYLFLDPKINRAPLINKLKQLNDIPHCSVALFFDDIHVNDSLLAQRQVDLINFIMHQLTTKHIIFCPTYYSFDPILNKIFGPMPKDYWSDLGCHLDGSIDVLWTGEKVISKRYSKLHLTSVSQLFRRKPIIWDNTSVTDGKKTSDFLPIDQAGDFTDIKDQVKAIWINPMNPAELAKITFLLAISNAPGNLESALDQLAPSLKSDILSVFDTITKGRSNLTHLETITIKQKFEFSKHPMAKNIKDWVDGVYEFDPDCLT